MPDHHLSLSGRARCACSRPGRNAEALSGSRHCTVHCWPELRQLRSQSLGPGSLGRVYASDGRSLKVLSAQDALAQLWSLARLPPEACSAVLLTGAEPALPSSFRIGTAAQASIAASALIAAEIHRLRSGQQQEIAVDIRDAAILFRSERYLSLNGRPCPEPVDAIFGLFKCGDGRWIRLHTNFPHHRDGVLRLLGGVAHNRDAVANALQSWTAASLEDACADAGLVATMARSFAEWDAHPQGLAVANIPPLIIERIGDAPPQPLMPGQQ